MRLTRIISGRHCRPALHLVGAVAAICGEAFGSALERLGDNAADLLSATKVDRVHLLSHSLAGVLIAQALTALFLDPMVDRVITFAPLDGPWATLIPAGTIIRALGKSSPGLRRLAVTSAPDAAHRMSHGHTWFTHNTTTRRSTMLIHKPRAHGRSRPLGAATAFAVMLTFAVGVGTGPATADSTPSTATAKAALTHIQRADAALARAGSSIRAHKYTLAVRSLTAARAQTSAANVAAMALIGAPPTDPESDDPPGPPAVLAALKLDSRISAGSVALFNKQTRPRLVQELRLAVKTAQVRQDTVLNRVIALPPEGAGSDYADSMADTLAMYTRQVTTISTALRTFTLTPAGTTGLTNALARAKATKAKVNRAFGGGERAAH